jgi:hypothetical protein
MGVYIAKSDVMFAWIGLMLALRIEEFGACICMLGLCTKKRPSTVDEGPSQTSPLLTR